MEEGREYSRCIEQRERLLSLLSSDMPKHLALDTVLLSILESTVAFLVEKGYAVCEDTYIAKERLLSSISSH